jgi:hypothetical protein
MLSRGDEGDYGGSLDVNPKTRLRGEASGCDSSLFFVKNDKGQKSAGRASGIFDGMEIPVFTEHHIPGIQHRLGLVIVAYPGGTFKDKVDFKITGVLMPAY